MNYKNDDVRNQDKHEKTNTPHGAEVRPEGVKPTDTTTNSPTTPTGK